MADNADSAPFPRAWVIDVCRTCGRVASWPFCAHRDSPPTDGSPWCAPVRVTGAMSPKSRIRPGQTTATEGAS